MVSDTMSRFQAAIVAADDDEAEAMVPELGVVDEPSLIALASSDDSNKRWWALRALAACGTQVSIGTVGTGLSDVDSSVRAVSVLALAHLHAQYPAGVRPVTGDMAKLLGDEDGFVRQAAADALAMCGDNAVGALSFVVTTAQGGARARAAYALRKIGTQKSAATLYPLLNDPNHLVRAYACEGLDAMGLLENVLCIP